MIAPKVVRIYLGSLLLSSLASAHPSYSNEKKDVPCSFLENKKLEEYQLRMGQGYKQARMRALNERSGDGGIPEGGFTAVKADIKKLLVDSQDFWPADFGHYGGLMIRLAWHCNGSYRHTDGRGGCDGGRIRFDPELNWPDNENLDKALELLKPIKEKYGEKLSWGDLISLTGTTAIEDMGGPWFGFCGGRIDDADGSNSLTLGPSDAQEAIAPCQSLNPDMQGQCLDVERMTAIGPTTVGLIYVNPAGPIGSEGNTVAAGADIRKAFARMGFDNRTSVALIGGGHAFGKCHGPCERALDDPPCGSGTDSEGKGNFTWTSGFEGAWTVTPTKWTNDYFTNMFNLNWTQITGPGGNVQYAPEGDNAPDIIMLTTDLALRDDDTYRPIAAEYAANITLLEEEFGAAWYRLMTADMGPYERCIGEFVPAEPQWWQYPLPASPTTLPDYIPVRTAIQKILDEDATAADAFINLAYRTSSTYRETDYRGGVNGARIRFVPESTWESNNGTADALALLEPVHADFSGVSYADLIVLAGITALEHENPDLELSFCGGYVDAEDASGSEDLAPRIYDTPYITVSDDCIVKGLSVEQCVAIASRLNVSTDYYAGLLAASNATGSADGYDDYELALLENDFLPYVQSFATNATALNAAFSSAWEYMMSTGRFKDYRTNACKGVSVATVQGETPMTAAPVAAPAPSPTPGGAPTGSGATRIVGWLGLFASLWIPAWYGFAWL